MGKVQQQNWWWNKVVFIALLSCIAFQGNTQNLLPNSSFEDTLLRITPLYAPAFWEGANTGSPDLMTPYNNNNRSAPMNFPGYQVAHTGKNYIGISIYTLVFNNASKRFREYIQNEMTEALVKDSTYCVQLYVSLADSFIYASKNKLGIHFSVNRVQSNNFFYLPVTPQIIVAPDTFIQEKESWLEYTYQYTASGGEKFITIGNFTDSTEVDTLNVGGGNDLQFVGTYYYIDDVYVGSCDSVTFDTVVGLQENALLQRQLNLFPNPAKNQVTLQFEVKPTEQVLFHLYNLQGQLISTRRLNNGSKHSIPLNNLPTGLYLYQLKDRQGRFRGGKLMVE